MQARYCLYTVGSPGWILNSVTVGSAITRRKRLLYSSPPAGRTCSIFKRVTALVLLVIATRYSFQLIICRCPSGDSPRNGCTNPLTLLSNAISSCRFTCFTKVGLKSGNRCVCQFCGCSAGEQVDFDVWRQISVEHIIGRIKGEMSRMLGWLLLDDFRN